MIIAYDRTTKSAINISHKLPEVDSGVLISRAMLTNGLNVDPSHVILISIIPGLRSDFNRDTFRLIPLTKMKLQQTELVGLRPILVSFLDSLSASSDSLT